MKSDQGEALFDFRSGRGRIRHRAKDYVICFEALVTGVGHIGDQGKQAGQRPGRLTVAASLAARPHRRLAYASGRRQ